MNLERINQGLRELILFVLDWGIKCVRDLDSPFIPCVVVEDEAGVRYLHNFVADRLEQAIDQAMVFADTVDAQSRVAVSYEGFVTLDGAQMDAIMVVAWDRGRTENPVVFAQPYKRKNHRQRFRTVGNPAFLGSGASQG